MNRRRFTKTALTISAASILQRAYAGQPLPTKQRLEWTEYLKTSQYAVFLKTIEAMRSNKNSNDENSWLYWANVHENNCPHGIPYFLAWHRGYIWLFERQLQKISGNKDLTLPYWNYYKNTKIPKEFTDNKIDNPLYVERASTDIAQAISYSPFADSIKNFQRGTNNPFEPTIESRPHNQVHNLIGGFMPTMQSPQDPIFWLHHANIDRLWACWANSSSDKKIPTTDSQYWAGVFNYASGKTIEKTKTYDTISQLNYSYDDLTIPKAVSQMAPTKPSKIVFVKAPIGDKQPGILSLGKPTSLALGEESVSVDFAITNKSANTLSEAHKSGAAPSSLTVILSGIQLTEIGKKGGYFYKVYLNLPSGKVQNISDEDRYLGAIGPFEVNSAQHANLHHAGHAGHAGGGEVSIQFSATDIIKSIPKSELSSISVSFIRVNGDGAPKGEAIMIKNLSLQISNAPTE